MRLYRTIFAASVVGTLLVVAACSQGSSPTVSPAPAAEDPTAPPVASEPVRNLERTPSAEALPTPSAGPVSRDQPPPLVTARSLLVFDEASGAALYESNAHMRLPPASLTKIATAVLVLESGIDLQTLITVHPDLEKEWLEDSATMGLLPGDSFSVHELLYGMLLVSGNDAARELAQATAGTEESFVDRMNDLAKRLALRDTHFTDVHGLGGPDHYSSAWDLAQLSKYAMTFPEFRVLVGTETHVASGTRDLSLYNLNPLLNYTRGVDGIKTGYTEEAGPTFVACADRGGHRVIVVMLDAPSMALDAIALIEWAFANFEWAP